MILTAEDESGRVHFPLPLTSLEEPDIATMRRTLQRLQSQYDNDNDQSFSMHNRTMTDLTTIDQENDQLKHEI